jgi:hypothetical protein
MDAEQYLCEQRHIRKRKKRKTKCRRIEGKGGEKRKWNQEEEYEWRRAKGMECEPMIVMWTNSY